MAGFRELAGRTEQIEIATQKAVQPLAFGAAQPSVSVLARGRSTVRRERDNAHPTRPRSIFRQYRQNCLARRLQITLVTMKVLSDGRDDVHHQSAAPGRPRPGMIEHKLSRITYRIGDSVL